MFGGFAHHTNKIKITFFSNNYFNNNNNNNVMGINAAAFLVRKEKKCLLKKFHIEVSLRCHGPFKLT